MSNIFDDLIPEEERNSIANQQPVAGGLFGDLIPEQPEDQSIFREVADVPLQVGKGVTTGGRMIAEAFGAEMADSGDDYGFQITDLVRQVAELQGRTQSGLDLEWKLEELENSVDWEFDDLTRQLTDLRVRVETSGGVEQWEIDDLYGVTDELFDMVWRMWAALESRSWPAEYLYD